MTDLDPISSAKDQTGKSIRMMCFTHTEEHVVRINKALFTFTVCFPVEVKESWNSGIWIIPSTLHDLNEQFKIQWSDEFNWDLPITKLSIHDSSVLIAAMSEVPGEHKVCFIAHGSAYWLYHDLVHVKRDIRIEDGRIWPAHSTELFGEDEVYEISTRLAKRHGISQDEIEREIERVKTT